MIASNPARPAVLFHPGRLLLAAVAGLGLGLSACTSTPLQAVPAPVATAPQAPTWTRLYVFGDSYSDTGYGIQYSEGPSAIAYAAQSLGLNLTHTRAPDWQGKSLNFAFSGAQTGLGGGGGGMLTQASDFAALVASRQVEFDPEHTLFFVAGGLNDRALTIEQSEANLTQLVTQLKGLGARHFEITNMPEKIPSFAQVGIKLNPMLTDLPAKLTRELGVDVRLSRWGSYFDGVMDRAAALGITNTTAPCAPGGPRAAPGSAPVCPDPEHYYYYFSGHPSTTVHRLIAPELVQELAR